PRRVRNSRRMAALETRGEGWEIRNDEAHDFSLLHYYATRDEMVRRLAASGFALLACVDLAGREVGPGSDAADTPELHYVARRAIS
ncbi:MAG: class SAM-dependent methyltransferase, partial [Solirubrobacterales bacterium]|nr:class SAM-dependent methyltransferase [Solirubrobacterales bacterium]